MSPEFLATAALNPETLFKPSEIRSVKGKMREIDPPTPAGRRLLKRLNRLLERVVPPHPLVHGGAKGRSCFTAARVHAKSEHLSTRDIRDCYPSINRGMMTRALEYVGFSPETATVVGSLLTPYDRVAQGSNASGSALNIFLREFDERLWAWCQEHGAIASRTYDDIVVSTQKLSLVQEAGGVVDRYVSDSGLRVSERKKKKNGTQSRSQKGERPMVHKIEVGHGGKLRIAREHRITAILLAHQYVGACRSVQPRSIRHVAKLRERLTGWIYYSSMADQSPVRELKRLRECGDRLVLGRVGKAGMTAHESKWWLNTAAHPELDRIAISWSKIA